MDNTLEDMYKLKVLLPMYMWEDGYTQQREERAKKFFEEATSEQRELMQVLCIPLSRYPALQKTGVCVLGYGRHTQNKQRNQKLGAYVMVIAYTPEQIEKTHLDLDDFFPDGGHRIKRLFRDIGCGYTVTRIRAVQNLLNVLTLPDQNVFRLEKRPLNTFKTTTVKGREMYLFTTGFQRGGSGYQIWAVWSEEDGTDK